MLLSDVEIGKNVIRNHAEIEEAKGFWERGEWERIGERIILDPYNASVLNPMSYPLSVGAEWLSLRDPYTVKQLAADKTFTIAPHETILILCEEYVALPRTIAGLVVPRARKLFEGCNLSATRVDPTWYGKLLVGFTNTSQYTTSLIRGEKFCNLILLRIGVVGQPLSKSSTPHLGRTTIGKAEYPSLRPERLKEPDQVSSRDILEMVENFGAPFDIVRGALKETKDEIIRAVEKDLGPRMVDTAVTQATQRAFRTQQIMFSILLGLFAILIGGILTFLFTR
jgi:deoxycytidine triphosphate deaminase